MRYRTFGRTGLEVSTVSMGCNRLGDPGTTTEQWLPVVRRALDLGVTFFDTSNSYNQGRSEAILGEVAGADARPVVIATKVGVPVETNDFANRDFSAGGILVEVENSLRRLRRETIDLYMLHSPSVQQLEIKRLGDGDRPPQGTGQGPLLRHLDARSRLGRLGLAPRRRLPPDRISPARSDRRGRTATAGRGDRRRHHGADAAGARPLER